MYRDVTPLLAIDETFDRPATVETATEAVRGGNLAIVASAADAVATLVALGAPKTHAVWLVDESGPAAAATSEMSILFSDEFKYSPDQPRIPAGQPGGGRWVDTPTGGFAPTDTVDLDTGLAAVRSGRATRLTATDTVAALERIGSEDDGKVVDLTNVQIEGHLLFTDARRHGVRRRKDMPQIPPEQIDNFQVHLEDEGVTFTDETVDPLDLKSTQTELDAVKVGKILAKIRGGTFVDGDRPWVSSDGYVLDGHHRWAAYVALEAADLDYPEMKVKRVDLPIRTLLALADEFNTEFDIQKKSIGMAAILARFGFNPNQPRVPAGSSAGGQFAPTGGGGTTGAPSERAREIIDKHPDRIPLTALGIEPAPKDVGLIAHRTRDDAEWDDVPVTKIRSDAKFYGTETDVSTKSVKKVVLGDEPLREGYAPRVYEYGDGYIIADGHHRLAMHVLMGTPGFDAHVRKLPRSIRLAGPRNKRKSRAQWLGDVFASTTPGGSMSRTFRVAAEFHLKGTANDHNQQSHAGGGGKADSGGITPDTPWVKELAEAGGDEGDAWLDDLPGYDRERAKADADRLHAKAVAEEPRITARLEELAGDDGAVDYHEPTPGEGQLFGYKYRFKKEAKIAEKIGRKMRDDDLGYEDAVARQNDALRYTVHYSEDDFGVSAQNAINGLRADMAEAYGISIDDPKLMEYVKVKNTWPPEAGVPYKGVNVVVHEPDGFKWELQFHTPESQRVKDEMHLLYEAQRVLPKDDPRWRQLDEAMDRYSKRQPTPRDATKVFRVARAATMRVGGEER